MKRHKNEAQKQKATVVAEIGKDGRKELLISKGFTFLSLWS